MGAEGGKEVGEERSALIGGGHDMFLRRDGTILAVLDPLYVEDWDTCNVPWSCYFEKSFNA